jgi:exopolysaccharide production protein ExoZ
VTSAGSAESDPFERRSAPASAEPRPKLVSIQVLRGIAASAVVLFHASIFAGWRIDRAAFGVDLFFVISGFIMVMITDDRSRPWPFLKDRLLRIVPLYWIATLTYVAYIVTIPRVDPPTFPQLLASLAFFPYAHRPGVDPTPLLPLGWTLNYEMMFYVVFAAILLIPRRLQLPALTATFVVFLAVGWLVRPDSVALAFWFRPIIFEFLAGAWLARFLVHREASRRGGPLLLLVGIAVFLAADPLTRMAGLPPLGAVRVTLAIPAALILAGAVILERSRPARGALMRFGGSIGDASYSIYLWHPMILLVVKGVAGHLPLPGAVIFFGGTAAGIVGGWVAYRLIEKPLLDLFRRRYARRGVVIPSAP